MDRDQLKTYSVEELIQAFEFYLKGPIENKQMADMLKVLARTLIDWPEELPFGYVVQIDGLLERYYLKYDC